MRGHRVLFRKTSKQEQNQQAESESGSQSRRDQRPCGQSCKQSTRQQDGTAGRSDGSRIRFGSEEDWWCLELGRQEGSWLDKRQLHSDQQHLTLNARYDEDLKEQWLHSLLMNQHSHEEGVWQNPPTPHIPLLKEHAGGLASKLPCIAETRPPQTRPSWVVSLRGSTEPGIQGHTVTGSVHVHLTQWALCRRALLLGGASRRESPRA